MPIHMYLDYFTCAHDGHHLQLALVVFSYANECITGLMCRNAYVCMGVQHTVAVVVFCCAYLAVCVLVCICVFLHRGRGGADVNTSTW